jgi:hypothetical protein
MILTMKKPFFCLLLTVVLTACTKAPYPPDFVPGPAYNIPAEFKAWTIFNHGSWWVYKNERTGVTDTTTNRHGPFYHKELCGNCPVIEYMWFYLNGTVVTMYDVQGGENENAILRIRRENGSAVPALTNKTLTDPAHTDSSYGVQYQFVEQIDAMTLNGNILSNVYHTRFELQSYYGNPPFRSYEFYFARGIGLVMLKKIYTSTDTTWSLVDWHTEQ